jgi:hypothetical protein
VYWFHCVKCEILQAKTGLNLLEILYLTEDSKQIPGRNAGGARVSLMGGLQEDYK